jgi:hypothetical protein
MMNTKTDRPMMDVELYAGPLDGHLCDVPVEPGCMGLWIFEHRTEDELTRHAYEMMPRTTPTGRWELRWNCCVSRQRRGGVS